MRTFLSRATRSRRMLAGAAVFALAAAGYAIAGPGPASISLVNGTFAANTVLETHSSTCTVTGGHTINVTDWKLTGTAAGDSHLTGSVTAHVKSVYDVTNNVGTLKGELEIDNTSVTPNNHFHAKLQAVNVGSNVQGFLNGNAGGGNHFMGNFTATFATTGGTLGFSTGKIGLAGSTSNAAAIWSGDCKGDHPKPNPPHTDTHPKGPHTDTDTKPGKGPKH
jgi:hypothetical protein